MVGQSAEPLIPSTQLLFWCYCALSPTSYRMTDERCLADGREDFEAWESSFVTIINMQMWRYRLNYRGGGYHCMISLWNLMLSIIIFKTREDYVRCDSVFRNE